LGDLGRTKLTFTYQVVNASVSEPLLDYKVDFGGRLNVSCRSVFPDELHRCLDEIQVGISFTLRRAPIHNCGGPLYHLRCLLLFFQVIQVMQHDSLHLTLVFDFLFELVVFTENLGCLCDLLHLRTLAAVLLRQWINPEYLAIFVSLANDIVLCLFQQTVKLLHQCGLDLVLLLLLLAFLRLTDLDVSWL